MPNRDKTVFVACPLGDEDSPERVRSDRLLKYIIEPVIKPFGYEVIRSDKIMDNGNITVQIIEYLMSSAIVLADMTDHNPNVFYELAVRHSARKPAVHLIIKGQRIPFDVTTDRAISYGFEPEEVEEAKDRLKGLVEAIKVDDSEPYSPITSAITRISLSASNEPDKRIESGILEQLEDIKFRLGSLDSRLEKQQSGRPLLRTTYASAAERSFVEALEGATAVISFFVEHDNSETNQYEVAKVLKRAMDNLDVAARRGGFRTKVTQEHKDALRDHLSRLSGFKSLSDYELQ